MNCPVKLGNDGGECVSGFTCLMVRSAAEQRVSNHRGAPSFETPAFAPASAGSSG